MAAPVTESDARASRRGRGEYYSPAWLAGLLLDLAGYDGDPRKRLVDPSCGSGVFLTLAIERAADYARRHGWAPEAAQAAILANIHGFELNPQAAAAARAAYSLALRHQFGDRLRNPQSPEPEIPVFVADAILDPVETGPFDYVAGNPPWVRWDYLDPEYRRATEPLWKRYGLFTLSGFEARLGGGKKDLAMLFTYAAADRYLKDGGKLAFLITQEVFKSKGAAEGFRRFRIGGDGAHLKVLEAHDFTSLQPFRCAGNKTAAILLTKGPETTYPVPYYIWRRRARSGRLPEAGSTAEILERLEKIELAARPVGSIVSAWRTSAPAAPELSHFRGESAYRARLGANANPYGVFWLEVLGVLPDGRIRIRNLVEAGRTPLPSVQAEIEPDLVYPSLRGADVAPWNATVRTHVLLVQDPGARSGWPVNVMESRWPATLGYISRFREQLLARALYRKYHAEAGHPWYSQFNAGPETLAPFKVVWRRMANRMAAAVVSQWDGPLGRRVVVPLETTAFIGTDNPEEAHYLCAMLNSEPVREYVKSFSSAGRGFGTPSVIGHVRLPRFDTGNTVHLRLAALSQELHALTASGNPGRALRLEAELAEVVHEA